jgi:protein deglycase
MKKRVLCLLMEGFEEIETVTPVDLLRRAGAEVVLAALKETMHVTGRSGIVVKADARLDEFDVHAFDALLIPGGPAVKALRADGRPATIAKTFAVEGKLVASICAGPLVLHDAGLLTGKRYTAHDSTYGELTQALAHDRVVEDRNLITSRGAGTALDFGLALVRYLFGAAEAEKVAKAVMA